MQVFLERVKYQLGAHPTSQVYHLTIMNVSMVPFPLDEPRR